MLHPIFDQIDIQELPLALRSNLFVNAFEGWDLDISNSILFKILDPGQRVFFFDTETAENILGRYFAYEWDEEVGYDLSIYKEFDALLPKPDDVPYAISEAMWYVPLEDCRRTICVVSEEALRAYGFDVDSIPRTHTIINHPEYDPAQPVLMWEDPII